MKLKYVPLLIVFCFLSGMGVVRFSPDKVILDKAEHKRQCRRNIGIGNFICNTTITLEETKQDWCK